MLNAMFDNYDNYLLKKKLGSLLGIEQSILNLVSRLDIYHLINSWVDMGIKYDHENNNKWSRDTMIIHHADIKTKVGLPGFITFLPSGLFLADVLILIFIGLIVATCFFITYLASMNLGYIFSVAVMTFFCLSWPDKRLDPMLTGLTKVILLSYFPIAYSIFRELCFRIINYLKKSINLRKKSEVS